MKLNHVPRAVVLFVVILSLLPTGGVGAIATTSLPPADMFQLPWEQGLAWVAIDGIDNGSKRPLTSSHQYTVGGAIDFAPHNNMIRGEDTSNYWVTAAAAGTVVGVSGCHIIIEHGNGWITQYQFLANVQVGLGDGVDRNQRLGIIADGVRYKYCPGSVEPNVPHLHFMLRPTMIGATFAGWEVKYNSFFNFTTFTKNGETVGLYKPLLNTFDLPSTTPSPTLTMTPPSSTPMTPTPSATSSTPTGTTPTPTGPYGSTTVDSSTINVGETTLVTVSLNNVPPEGYTSAEFTCTYDPVLLEVSNIVVTNLFGADPAVAIYGPQNGSFIVAIAGSHGNKATTSGPVFTFNVKGLQVGQTTIECKPRVSIGNSELTDLPSIGTIVTILGIAPTPTFTSTSVPPTDPSYTATPTSPVDLWLTFFDQTYGFQFKYPPQGVIDTGSNDNFTRIYLPSCRGRI